MKSIKKILMERDNMTELEAENYLEDIREDMNYAIEIGDYSLAEDIMLHDLGLEMDYIFQILY